MIKSSKIIICLILALILSTSVLITGCGTNDGESSSETTTVNVTKSSEQDTTAFGATEDTVPKTAQWNYSRLKLDADTLKSDFDNILTQNKFRGTVYVKIGNDFEYIGTNGFSNKANHTENSLDTCYRVASLTKQFTAAAIMQLKEQGKIKLENTIDKYYPSYKFGSKITVKNLLNMTSGLKDYLDKDGNIDLASYSSEQLEYDVKADNSAKENKKEIMDWIFSQELNFEPDSQFMYSNSSYYLLGDIIEQVSGKSYEDYIKDNILKPCGMNSSGFKATENLAKGYQDIYDSEWTLYPGVCYSAAGLISNVPDLLKWIDALCSNSVISKESFDEMTTPYKNGYGYGFFVSGNNISHSGKIDKYNSLISFQKDQSLIFIALSNYSQSEPSKFTRDFAGKLKPYYG